MRKTKRPLIAIMMGILIIAGAVGFVAGCGEQPLAPITHDGGGGSVVDPKHGGGDANSAGLLRDVVGVVNVVVKNTVEVIGVLGGQVCTSLGDGRKCGLDVPSGALDERTAISMRVEDLGGRKSAALFDFGPDGLVFEKPSTLFFDVRDPNGTVKTLTWWDPVAEKWVVQGTARVRDGRVTFSLNHFSKYGIS